MKQVQILIDSACDMQQPEADRLGVTLLPRIDTEAVTTDTSRINGAGDGTRTVTLLYPVHALGLPRERADTALCDTLVRVLEQFLQNL